MCGERKFEPSAKNPPFESRDNRNRCRLDPCSYLGNGRNSPLRGCMLDRQADAEIRTLPRNHDTQNIFVRQETIKALHQGSAQIVVKDIAGSASHHQMAYAPVTHDPDRTSHDAAPVFNPTSHLFGRRLHGGASKDAIGIGSGLGRHGAEDLV